MRARWMYVCFVLAWIALAVLATLEVLLYLRQERLERAIEDSRRHPKVVYRWGEEDDDARHRLDKSDKR